MFHLVDVKIPVPPPRLARRGEWVNVCTSDSAAGVAVFSIGIHVSVNPRNCSDLKAAWPTIVSAMRSFTAEWQFKRPHSIDMCCPEVRCG